MIKVLIKIECRFFSVFFSGMRIRVVCERGSHDLRRCEKYRWIGSRFVRLLSTGSPTDSLFSRSGVKRKQLLTPNQLDQRTSPQRNNTSSSK